MDYINGDEYQGQWINDLYHGNGTLRQVQNQVVIKGQFKNGKPNGFCVKQNKFGFLIEGEFQDG